MFKNFKDLLATLMGPGHDKLIGALVILVRMIVLFAVIAVSLELIWLALE